MERTFSPKKEDLESQRRWWVVDAEGVTFGRLCTRVAKLLTGKHKPTWAPHVDSGDFVIVVNAGKIVLTGRKREQKVYYRHSTHPGGLKAETAGQLLDRDATRLIERGVRGMLPKNRLGRRQIRKLKVYAGPEHRHQAQQPDAYSVA